MEEKDWLKDFFDSGFYEKYWCWKYSDDDARQLAEDTLKLLGAQNGHMLDWCGGWGRVSINYGKKGFKVTILDFMPDYLDRAKELFKNSNLEVSTIHSDCRETPDHIQADYAVCSFCSIGFFDDEGQVKAFKSLYNALKPGGKFLVDCINLSYVAELIEPVDQYTRGDGYTFRQSNDFNYMTSTLHTWYEIINKEGKTEAQKEFRQRLYMPVDLKRLLEAAGFRIKAMYGSYGGEPLSFEKPQIIAVAEK